MRHRGLGPVLLLLAACAGGSTTATTAAPMTTSTTPTTAADPATETTGATQGRIVSAEPLPSPDGITAWSIEYRSETVRGEPITVTGWIAIPDREPRWWPERTPPAGSATAPRGVTGAADHTS